MAEFPPNLDDGELWLPSDIYPDVEVPSKFRPQYMDELAIARGFAAFALLEPNSNQFVPKPPPNIPPHLERFHQPVQYRTNGSLPPGYFSSNGGLDVGRDLHGYGAEDPRTSSRPISHYRLIRPVRSEVEARARVLQEQQNVLLENRVFGNRFLPFYGTGDQSGIGLDGGAGGGGGYVRGYGGTGVFLPRIATTTGINEAGRKRKCVRNGQDTRVIPQRSSIRRVDLGKKQEECLYQLSHEIGLPQDWTY